MFIPFSHLRAMEPAQLRSTALPPPRNHEWGSEWIEFPIMQHMVFLVAAVPKCYLLFCKDYDLIEPKNCSAPLGIPADGLVAYWRRHAARATSGDSSGGSAESEQCRVCGSGG